MGRLFGTDGIRGIANRDLSIRRAEEVGMALAEVIRGEHPEKRPTVVIGRDTRLSGEMLQAALAGGLMAGGADVVLLGVVPTPAVAYLTVQKKAAAGVVISASHNPYEFNGIKIFGPEGYKLTDDEEDEIERMLLDRDIPMIPVEPEEIGTCREDREAAVQYAGYLASTVPEKLTGMKVLVDCSNGAAVRTAEELFSLLGAEATILCDAPDGTNINRECGSTHVEHLASLMAEGKYDLAVAFDGDADRCLAVDEKGNVITGDHILYIYGCYMKEHGELMNNTVVTTVMSNFGLYKAFDEQGIGYAKTAVGDKYVYEYMAKNGCRIGGEQSGHIIFSKYASTGDGILTSLKMMEVMLAKKMPMSKLAEPLKIYPQVLENVRVTDKKAAQNDPAVQEAVKAVAEALGDTGRILVRESGTEPLVRVMVEAPDHDTCQKYVSQVVEVIKSKGYAV